jgi:hypothetical protein
MHTMLCVCVNNGCEFPYLFMISMSSVSAPVRMITCSASNVPKISTSSSQYFLLKPMTHGDL